MKTKFLIFFSALILLGGKAWADSPITSTYFADEYFDVPIMGTAIKANGKITTELMDYLVNSKNPVDVKLAIINELSWDISGKKNAEIFEEYLYKNTKFKNYNQLLKKADADILICLAYLKAMDDYNHPENALVIAKKAQAKNKNSYSIQFIRSIIEAQVNFDDWCKVYTITHAVRENKKLKKDMRASAIIKAHEYCDGYKEYCK